jgi:hypothetical protein
MLLHSQTADASYRVEVSAIRTVKETAITCSGDEQNVFSKGVLVAAKIHRIGSHMQESEVFAGAFAC